MDTRNTAALTFEIQGAERLRIDSSGNVGIGTTDPSASLTIESEGSDTPMQGSHLLDIKSTGNSKLADIRLSAKDSAGASRAGGLGFNADDNVVYLANNGVQYLNVGNNGNVGIGTTDPISKLHVDSGEAELTFGNNASGGNANLRIWRNDSDIAINNPLGYLSFAGSDAATSPTDHAAISAVAEETHEYTSDPLSEKNGTQLRFFTTNLGQSAMSQKMTISANGNVGIGTTDPSAKLHVNESVDDTNTGLTISNYDNTAGTNQQIGLDFGLARNSGALKPYAGRILVGKEDDWVANDEDINAFMSFNVFHNNDIQERMRIDSAGNVGIGTTSPGSYKLNVNGNVFASSYTPTSDDRVKHNEQPIVGALETLSKITPKKYIKTVEMYDVDHDFELDADGNPVDENGEPVEHRVEAGVIAQQVLTVDELAFAVSPEGVDQGGTVTSPHGLDYNSLFTYAIAAIQEQQQLIEQLKSQNESLATRISALES